MHFTINGKRYVVVVASRPIVLDGETCRAKVDHLGQRILICGRLPRHERRRELFHELTHCWRDAHGVPSDEEQDAIGTSEMMDVILEQYLQQGGDAVLEGLDPAPDAPANPHPTGPYMGIEAECGYCHAKTAVGSIAADAPEFNQDTQGWMLDRGILCGVCDRVTTWRERCTSEGMPLGFIVPHPPPRVLDGPAAAEWIFRHAKTIGAIVTRAVH